MMTGLGLDLETSWRGLLAAKSPIKRFTLFDPEGLGASYGVELPPGADAVFEDRITKRRRGQMTRGTMIAYVTAEMAIASSGLDLATADRSRIGAVVGGTGTGYVGPASGADSERILRNMPSAPAAWISIAHKLEGPSFMVSTACSSGAYALASAYALIESGLCDVVVGGSADSSLNYVDVQGFSAIMALSENAPVVAEAACPFDRRRDGFVMGEGGGFLVLERLERARARGARVFAEMSMPGLTSEAYNIMSPAKGGVGMAETMRRALDLSGLQPADIDYINAHGTSTKLNDRYETEAIKAVWGPRAPQVPISSTKSMTGHCLAGAAGVEAVICCKALIEGVIPPTANLREPDDGLDLDYVPLDPRRATLRHVMCNSFAFGGHNGVLIFSRADV
jgi:3-oxoacyl-[acyl-carrier-protein] synthase II